MKKFSAQGIVEYALIILLVAIIIVTTIALLTQKPPASNEYCRQETDGTILIDGFPYPKTKTVCITPAPTATPDKR